MSSPAEALEFPSPRHWLYPQPIVKPVATIALALGAWVVAERAGYPWKSRTYITLATAIGIYLLVSKLCQHLLPATTTALAVRKVRPCTSKRFASDSAIPVRQWGKPAKAAKLRELAAQLGAVETLDWEDSISREERRDVTCQLVVNWYGWTDTSVLARPYQDPPEGCKPIAADLYLPKLDPNNTDFLPQGTICYFRDITLSHMASRSKLAVVLGVCPSLACEEETFDLKPFQTYFYQLARRAHNEGLSKLYAPSLVIEKIVLQLLGHADNEKIYDVAYELARAFVEPFLTYKCQLQLCLEVPQNNWLKHLVADACLNALKALPADKRCDVLLYTSNENLLLTLGEAGPREGVLVEGRTDQLARQLFKNPLTWSLEDCLAAWSPEFMAACYQVNQVDQKESPTLVDLTSRLNDYGVEIYRQSAMGATRE